MAEKKSYLVYPYNDTVVNDIVKGIDQDLEKSEKILMFGLSFGMFSSLLAPMAPPTVLLLLVALNFIITSSWAHINYHRMEIRFFESTKRLSFQQKAQLNPIAHVFESRTVDPLVDEFNPLKKLKRTWKSVMGGLIMNPLWIPIFYALGIQIGEEKNVYELNKAIIGVEGQLGLSASSSDNQS